MRARQRKAAEEGFDAVDLQVFRHLLAAIPEEMGVRLERAAFSPNIKERLDFSCALTTEDGSMAAQASHIPVHLGATHVTGAWLAEHVAMRPGDVVAVNDPWAGGTHLPDITLFAPVFLDGAETPSFGALARAHHADVGGAHPGSMGPARDVHGEGLVIPPVRLVREGRIDEDVLAFLLANTRTPDERRGDLEAQRACVELGRARIEELARRHGTRRLQAAVRALREHTARVTRAMLSELAPGPFTAETRLDGPDSPRLVVSIERRGRRLRVDFTGTDPQIERPLNANRAITLSAVFYAVRLLLGEEVPTNSGCLDPIEVVIPEGSVLSARRPAPVAGGNVETSQRVVELLLLALAQAAPGRVPAASQGTMNNLTFGSRGDADPPWTFYETLGGGAGGGPGGPGESGLQTHMTNTMNTPIEALESSYPVRVEAFGLRSGSGGEGQHAGGEGLVRVIRALEPARATILATRRHDGAPGLEGGAEGAPARDEVRQAGRWRPFPASGSVALEPGDAVRVRTPGGGGHGAPAQAPKKGTRKRSKRA